MFQIGENYEDFLNRYVENCLEPEASILFDKNRIGAAKLDSICKNGFDPQRRSRQVHGSCLLR